MIIKEVGIEEVVKIGPSIIEFDEAYNSEYFTQKYKDKEHLIIVAYVEGEPAGYIVGYDQFEDGSFYCWMAAVNPDFRKKGILKSLMDYQQQWAKQKSYTTIKIKTRNERREMLSYLVKYGFNFIELEKYPNVIENRILLQKEI